MKTLSRPTRAELAILRVIWSRGPSTVREIQEVLERIRPTGYTTVLKLLQIMTDKGLVRRNESGRTHIYRTRLSEEQTQRQLVRDLLERAFGGSAAKLVMQALAAKPATAGELAEIQALLDRRRKGPDDAPSD
ncbi:MAG: BlaI/MecI/CopY family transcriptional regulator [Acidobacteria bacterium]|nr:BlaI/MecI/CopY family transcriptional regulator [Acidobacteriota bacterium]